MNCSCWALFPLSFSEVAFSEKNLCQLHVGDSQRYGKVLTF